MTFNRLLRLCVCAAFPVLPGTLAYAAERMPATTIKPLLIAAINRGESHGVLVGEAAAFMRGRFGSNAPVEIDVKTLATLPQPGCKRLEVTTRQSDVTEAASTAPVLKKLVYQVSYCRTGRFPDSK